MPTPSPIGSAAKEVSRASTAAPPATANPNGTKPAARRACEIETASAKCVKRSGSTIRARTRTKPPSTNAAQRRFAASTNGGGRGTTPPEPDPPPRALRGEQGRRPGGRRGARQRPAPAEDLGREPVAPVREHIELSLVVLERAVHLVRGRVDRRRLA